MRHLVVLAVFASLFVSQAEAQPAAPPDPKNLALARELVEISGGRKAVEDSVRATVLNIKALYARSFDPKVGEIVDPVYTEFESDVMKQVPQLMDTAVSIYAENYTRKELEDYLAWLKSDSGQAVIRKGPLVARQISEASQPLYAEMLPKILTRTVERLCEERHCTPDQRQKIDAAMASMLKK